MSLETPDRTRAAAVLLIQNFVVGGPATVDFLSNNGFASAAFVDPTLADTLAIVLEMDQPVTNNEGAVAVGGDITSEAGEAAGYITPNHYTNIAILDALLPFQVVIETSVGPATTNPVFRLTVSVMKITVAALTDEVKAELEGEPQVPPV